MYRNYCRNTVEFQESYKRRHLAVRAWNNLRFFSPWSVWPKEEKQKKKKAVDAYLIFRIKMIICIVSKLIIRTFYESTDYSLTD